MNNAAPPAAKEQVITLTGAQLLQALDFIAPDRDTDPTQLECELRIAYGDGHAGKGYYGYFADCPDEGSSLLDAEAPDAPTALVSADPDQQRIAAWAAVWFEINRLDPNAGRRAPTGVDCALSAIREWHRAASAPVGAPVSAEQHRETADERGVRLIKEVRAEADSLDQATDAVMSAYHATANGKALQRSDVWLALENTIKFISSAAPVAAQAQPDQALPYETALAELIGKIVPGLDSGDILADAHQASMALAQAQQPVSGADWMTSLIDAAMEETKNIHPPIKRSVCERLIRAALAQQDAALANREAALTARAALAQHLSQQNAETRNRALVENQALAEPVAAQAAEPKLDKPAKVGGCRFGAGIKWSTVIKAAQRLYEYEVTPEKEAERIAGADQKMQALQHHIAAQAQRDADRVDAERWRHFMSLLDSMGDDDDPTAPGFPERLHSAFQEGSAATIAAIDAARKEQTR